MSDSQDNQSLNLSASLRVWLQHLQRTGVAFLPTGDANAAAGWVTSEPANSAAPMSPTRLPAAEVRPPAPKHAAVSVAAIPPSEKPLGRLAPAPAAAPLGVVVETAYPGPVLPIAQRQAAMDLIREEVRNCTQCEVLVRTRKQTVPGEGSLTARVCFMGEAPGADEDSSGQPFVGRAGQLLTKMIEACKMKREEVFILNTLKCRPPHNRTPEPIEVNHCRDFFERQLDLLQPEYIVCLGVVAAQSLLNTTLTVGRLRGRFHQYRGSKVLVTYHPSYLLREPDAKKAAWADLQMLMRDMGIATT